MKHKKYVDLTQVMDKCDHPEECVTESPPDSWGLFTYYCIKCNTTFTRYDYSEIEHQRKINSKRVDDENAYRIYQ